MISIQPIQPKDRALLRDLAKQQAALAHSPAMDRLRAEWLRHNTFRPGRPMITVELWTFVLSLIHIFVL